MWEDDGRRAVMQEMAEDAAADGRHFFYVRLPGNIQPLDRGTRFEDPLETRLAETGLGEVTGGGSQLGDDDAVEYCGIDVVVTRRQDGLALILEVLRAARCPADSVVEEYIPLYRELPVWSD